MQDVTKLFNLKCDIVDVVKGIVRIYLEPTVFNSKVKYMDLLQDDFIDASQPLKQFKTARQESINRHLREMIINKVEI